MSEHAERILFHRAGHHWAFALLFEPRDLWVGVYWNRYFEGPRRSLDVFLTVVPMLPVRITVTR